MTHVDDRLGEPLAAVVAASTRHRQAAQIADAKYDEWLAAVVERDAAARALDQAQNDLHSALTELPVDAA